MNHLLVRIIPLSLIALLSACATGKTVFPHPVKDKPLSKAIRVDNRVDNTVFVSGHLGVDPETGKPPSDPKKEIQFALDAFESTLANTGMRMDDLVRFQVFCSDLSLYDTFNELYRKRFKDTYPTRAFIGSGPLLRGCRFEIQGIAAR